MDLPNLRHFKDGQIFSDPVEVLVGEAWVPAFYTDNGWATADGVSLLTGIEEWRNAVKEGQVAGCNLSQHQSGDESGQTAKASNRDRAVKSRKVSQAKG